MIYSGMHGLGDNLYQRAVIREVPGDHHLITSWPQLYSDLPNIRCVHPGKIRLRTQAKNVARQDLKWHELPQDQPIRPLHYVGRQGTMLQALCDVLGVKAERLTFDAPYFGSPTQRFTTGPAVEREPYLVVRPATIRKEWRSDGRNPRPEYIAQAVDALRGQFRIVSIADLAGGAEWAVQPLPYADETYHSGELSLEQMMALVAGASGVIGGVGWLVPAAVAYRVPMLLIFGGWGKPNGPHRIFDRRMDYDHILQALPDRFCGCNHWAHWCDKTISDMEAHIERFAIQLAAREPAAVAA